MAGYGKNDRLADAPGGYGAHDRLAPADAEIADPGFIPTVKRTGGQMLTTLATSIEDMTGQNRATRDLRDAGQGIIDRNPGGIDSVGAAIDSPWLAVKEATGQYVPQIAAAVAGGFAGAKVGARVGGAPGAAAGGILGGLAPIFTQEYGGIRQDQQEGGQEDIPRALAAATAATALERVGMGKVLKGIANPASVLMKGLPAEIGKGVVREGATEAAQNVIEQVGAFKDPTTSESLADTALAGTMGAIGGGVVGGAHAGVHKLMGARQPAEQTTTTGEQPAPIQAAPASDMAPPIAEAIAVNTPGDAIRAEKQPDTGPTTRALNAGIEDRAQQADAGQPLEPQLRGEPLPTGEVQLERGVFNSRDEMDVYLSQARRAGGSVKIGTIAPLALPDGKFTFLREGEPGFEEANAAAKPKTLAERRAMALAERQAVQPELAIPSETVPREAPEWQAFTPETGTKAIPRSDMPQVKADDRSALVQFLRARGIDYRDVELDAKTLKPTQAEFSPAKVQQARDSGPTGRSVLVSSDGHILDGHHQALAAAADGKLVKAIVLNAPINQLLAATKEFPSITASAGATPAAQPDLADFNGDRSAYLQARILSDLQPASYGGRRTAEKLADNQGEPGQPGVMVPRDEVNAAIKALVSSKRIKLKRGAYELVEKSTLADRRAEAQAERQVAAPLSANGREYRVGDSVAVSFPPEKAYPDGYDKTGSITAINGDRVTFQPNGGKTIVIGPERLGTNLSRLPGAPGALTPQPSAQSAPVRAMLPTQESRSSEQGEAAANAAPAPEQRASNPKEAGVSRGAPGAPLKTVVPAGPPGSVAPDKLPAETPARPKSIAERRAATTEQARAAYFAPGNVVKGYGGFDEVLSYTPPDANGRWSVRVHHVKKIGDEWVRDGKPQDARSHSTDPEARNLEAGPVASLPHAAGASVKYAEPRQDGKPFPNAPDRGLALATAEVESPKSLVERRAAAAAIEDFGQKLEGARKDQAPSLSKELTDEVLATEPFSKIWPAAEIDAIADKFAAAVAYAARAEVPAKPRTDYKVKRWVEKVKGARELAQKIVSGKFMRDEFIAELKGRSSLDDFRAKVMLLEAIDRDQWSRIGDVAEAPGAYRYDDGKQVKTPMVRVSVDGKTHWLNGSGAVADHVDAVNMLLGKAVAEQRMQFEVRYNAKDGQHFINKKGDTERRRLKSFGVGDDAKEALAYAKDHYDDLVAAWNGVKKRDNVKESDVRSAENRPRTAEDYRNGQDVAPDQFGPTFGFRGVQFGNWVAQGADKKARQGMLNQAYDALMDLANIVGVPPKALSLNGSLGLSFGARGSGWASAHYEPDTLVINLTKTRGAGTLAHEWFHALDNYFSHQRGGPVPMKRGMSQQDYRQANYITYRPEPLMVRKDGRGTPTLKAKLEQMRAANPGHTYLAADAWQPDAKHPDGVRPEVEQRFAGLVKALDESPMAARASAIDKGSSGYWSRVIERASRSFENFVIARMMEKGYHNDYLANVMAPDRFKGGRERYPYLLPEEVAPVAEAFDALLGGIKTREDDAGNVAMFNREDGAYTGGDGQSEGPDTTLQARRNIGLLGRDVAKYRGIPRADVDALHPFAGALLPGGAAIGEIAGAFGSKVQGFSLRDGLTPDERRRYGFFNGVRTSGIIFLRATGNDRPHFAVLGHELAHELATKDKALYRRLVDAIQPYIDQGKYPEFLKSTVARNVQGDKQYEEFVGEVLSDGFMDREFWRALGNKNPGLLRQVGDAVMRLVESVLRTVGYTKRTEKYLTDYKRVMQLAGEVMAEYAGKQAEAGDGIAFNRFDDAVKKGGNGLAHYRGMALQALGRRQIADLYAADLPQLPEYSELVQRMDADKNEAGASADEIATDWGKLADEAALANLMHDATLAQIDPAKEHDPADAAFVYRQLRQRYEALSDGAKATYASARDAFVQHRADLRQALRDRIERAEMSSARRKRLLEQISAQFDNQVKGVYFPLARFGQYVVVVRDRAGEVVNVTRAETLNEAAASQALLLRNFKAGDGYAVGKILKDREFNAAREAVGKGFMAELFETLERTGAGEDMLDAVGQLYLSSLPDVSWAKHGLHRKATPGFSQDARRAFAMNMFHGARYLAKLRYADRLHAEIDSMQKHVESKAGDEAYDSVRAQQVVDEMVRRHEQLMNPTTHPVATALTSIGFVFHLGLSPAAAITNLSGTALVAYPLMGAKWGFARAGAALLRASKQAATSRNDLSKALTGDEATAFEKAVRAGVIDVTQAHDLAGIADGEDSRATWRLRPVMRWASFLFHHAERFNRQVTFVAAYRLARGAGSNDSLAYEEAVKATYEGHFDYGASNRPRIMQGNWQRVILLFKQYAQNMIFTLVRQGHLSLRGATKEERAQARRALGGLLAMHAAGAGALGLPIVNTLLSAASMLGSDDDEPWDAKTALQNMLADTFGHKAAEVMAHGLSRLTPWDISGRVGLDRLLLPDVAEGLEGQRLAESWMSAALGPVAGIAVNAVKGLASIEQGRWAQGLEEMAPAALRGPLKAVRLGSEGAKDRGGVPILDEVDAAGVAGQALGFSPSALRNAMEGRGAVLHHDRLLVERRRELLSNAARASMAGGDTQAALAAVRTWNEKHPTRAISAEALRRSVIARQRRIAESKEGVYLPKGRRDALQEGRFAAAE